MLVGLLGACFAALGRRRLLKSCDRRDFADRRDSAIIRLFLDTGVRVSEAAGILLPDDLNLDD